jgi:hypothetical protein
MVFHCIKRIPKMMDRVGCPNKREAPYRAALCAPYDTELGLIGCVR